MMCHNGVPPKVGQTTSGGRFKIVTPSYNDLFIKRFQDNIGSLLFLEKSYRKVETAVEYGRVVWGLRR